MTNADFLTVSEFKSAILAENSRLEVLRNKQTGKLFMSVNGTTYRVQQDISSKLTMKVLIPAQDRAGNDYPNYETRLANACLVNVDESKGADAVFTL